MKKLIAEFIGTAWLVLGGCGSAVLAANFSSEPFIGIGLVGVSLAFGLTVLTIAYALGRISGAHLNPAVTIGLWAGGRVEASTVLPYVASQFLGGIAGAGILYVIATGNGSAVGDFAANGFGEHSPGGYDMLSAFVCEFVMTFMFIIIIFGVTEKDRARSLCRNCHRIGVDLDPFDQHSGNQHFCESGTKLKPGRFCTRLGIGAGLAVHRRTDFGRDCGRYRL
jgi:aquaporin Z